MSQGAAAGPGASGPVRARPRFPQAAWDAASWLVAVPVASLLRYDPDVPARTLAAAVVVGAACAVLQLLVGFSFSLYQGRYRPASFDEVVGVCFATLIVTAAAFVTLAVAESIDLPRSVPLIAGALALGAMLGGRFTARAYRQRFHYSRSGALTLIYGAGEAGEQLVRLMRSNPAERYRPIGFLDDDPGKRHLHLQGTRVLGTIDDLETVVRRTGATVLVVSIAAVEAAQLRSLDGRCASLGVSLRVIPSKSQIIDNRVDLRDIEEVSDEDLLGRRPIHTDEQAIQGFFAGTRVLITGGGGSIGSELARQVHRYHPEFLGILDRDESAMQAVQLSLDGRGLLDSDDLILADIRDRDRMREVLLAVRPDIVFHAAALKHLPLLERYPDEAHKTNVLGTMNLLDAAREAGVRVFVNISTDKAADPVCVLGRTKLETERMTAAIAPQGEERFISVRFGNVLGSRGSVVNAFRLQIQRGGPVTVTSPDVTRYFMTVGEAVHLVLQAAVIGRPGETLILDMGDPVRIDDVARHMIAKSGRDIPIEYTGLRPGEKLTETLVGAGEVAVSRSHPLILHTTVAVSDVPANSLGLSPEGAT
ncbi:MAG: nucleoside-diphosphate sugar epimerase/dehydratase [Actinomycetota bacterium]|nr:nucleoside-diphosphate sugar epimerase/dehydratase [Actinomycetota bacterium]